MEDDQKKWLYYAIPIAVVVALGAALYFGKRHKEEAAATEPVVEAPVATVSEPVEHHPIETPTPAEQLPTLADSDAPLQQSLSQIFGNALDRYLVPRDIIKRFVATIDNLPRKKTAVQMWPVKPLGGELAINGRDEITLNDANYDRYKPIVRLATSADIAIVRPETAAAHGERQCRGGEAEAEGHSQRNSATTELSCGGTVREQTDDGTHGCDDRLRRCIDVSMAVARR